MELFLRTCNYDRMNVQRIIARGLVLAGAAVMAAAIVGAFAGLGYTTPNPLATSTAPAVLLVAALAVFVVSLYFEVLSAVVLVVGALATAVWGIVAGWDGGLWGAMTIFVIAPMIVSGGMYYFAAQTQKACELDEAA